MQLHNSTSQVIFLTYTWLQETVLKRRRSCLGTANLGVKWLYECAVCRTQPHANKWYVTVYKHLQ